MEYTAIILRSDPFRESDRTIFMFTHEVGLVRLIAKGSQKITSKNATALEPGVLSIVGVAAGKELSYVTSAQAEEHFSKIRTDLLKSASVLYLSHLLARTLKEHDAHTALWQTYLGWLSAINTDTVFQLRMIDAMVFRMLAQIGFSPDLSGTGIAFSIADGRVVDTDTARILIQDNQQVIKIDTEIIETLRRLLTADWDVVQTVPIAQHTAATVHRIIYQYAQYHLERTIADWERMVYSFE